VFGPGADEPLDAAATEAAFAALSSEIAAATTGDVPRPEQIAAGFLRIAVERMANAIKQISVQRGHDITRFALCCFGGAGGQHAAQVAETLGIRRVIIHPLAGVLSAFGLGLADVRVLRQASVEAALDDALAATLAARFEPLATAAIAALREQGADAARVRLERRALVKVAGADTALPVAWQPGVETAELAAAFRAAHERHFGFRVEPAEEGAEAGDGRDRGHHLPGRCQGARLHVGPPRPDRGSTRVRGEAPRELEAPRRVRVVTADHPNRVQFTSATGLNCTQNAVGPAVDANWVRFMRVLGLNCARNAARVAVG